MEKPSCQHTCWQPCCQMKSPWSTSWWLGARWCLPILRRSSTWTWEHQGNRAKFVVFDSQTELKDDFFRWNWQKRETAETGSRQGPCSSYSCTLIRRNRATDSKICRWCWTSVFWLTDSASFGLHIGAEDRERRPAPNGSTEAPNGCAVCAAHWFAMDGWKHVVERTRRRLLGRCGQWCWAECREFTWNRNHPEFHTHART